jgi:O-antigen/teichoic acid export membrane protein
MTDVGDEMTGASPVNRGSRVAEIWRNITQAGPLALAGVIANGSNVLVTILLAHLLIATDYGYLNQLIGLFLIISTPGSAVIVAVVRRVTAWRVEGQNTAVRDWAVVLRRRAIIVYGVYVVCVVAFSQPLANDLLRNHSSLGVVTMLAGAGLWVVLCIDRGFLQATRRYRDLSSNFLVEGGVRFVAVLLFVALSPHVASACLGILVAEVATYLHARRTASLAISIDGAGGDDGIAAHPSAIAKDLLAAIFAMGFLAVLQNADVILIGRENHHLSGSYAAISVASKALCFIALVLGSYLVPEAAIHHGEGSHALRPLAATLAIVAAPALVLFALSSVAAEAVLRLVFSAKYLGAADAFSTLVLAMTALSVTMILTLYLLAIGKRWVVIVLAAGAGLLVGLTVHGNGSPSSVAHADLTAQLALVAVMIGCFVLTHLRDHRWSPSTVPSAA